MKRVLLLAMTLACTETPAAPGGTRSETSGDIVLEYDGALRVYHDVRHGVTCWVMPQYGSAGGAMACLPDSQTGARPATTDGGDR